MMVSSHVLFKSGFGISPEDIGGWAISLLADVPEKYRVQGPEQCLHLDREMMCVIVGLIT
jgi:hypothetical protein